MSGSPHSGGGGVYLLSSDSERSKLWHGINIGLSKFYIDIPAKVLIKSFEYSTFEDVKLRVIYVII